MIRVLDIGLQCSIMIMSSRSVLVFKSLLWLSLQLLVLAAYFTHSVFGFDVRAYTMANPALRPIALVVSTYSLVIASHCLARYVDQKEKTLLACTVLLTVGMIFFGSRGNILAIYINVLLCYLVNLRAKFSLFLLTIMISVLIVVGLFSGNLQHARFSL